MIYTALGCIFFMLYLITGNMFLLGLAFGSSVAGLHDIYKE